MNRQCNVTQFRASKRTDLHASKTARALRLRGTASLEMVVLFACVAVVGLGMLFYLGTEIRKVISG